MGAEAKEAVPALIEAMKSDEDSEVRSISVSALTSIGAEAKDVVPALTEALQDRDWRVRYAAARALGEVGAGAESTIPALVTALKREDDPDARDSVISALNQISDRVVDNRNMAMLPQLKEAYSALKDDPHQQEPASAIKRRIDYLEVLSQDKPQGWLRALWSWLTTHPIIGGIIIGYASLLPFWLLVYLLRPLWLLSVSTFLRRYEFKMKVANREISLPFRHLLFISPFHPRQRVLDAWVRKYVETARENFAARRTVREREMYVTLPVQLDEVNLDSLAPGDLGPVFAGGAAAKLLILGEGGSGKSSLACLIARWSMAEKGRLSERLMLPVFVESELDFEGEGKDFLRETAGARLRELIGALSPLAPELLNQLLKRKRLLVILDGVSEMSEATRTRLHRTLERVPYGAFIVTSRLDEFDNAPKHTLKPPRISGTRLLNFIEDYLSLRGKRDLFTEEEFFAASQRLALIVGDREVTALIAKLYVERMIALKEEAAGEWVDSISDLMLDYLATLNAAVDADGFDNETVLWAAATAAWECVHETFRPVAARRGAIIEALKGRSRAEELLDHLEAGLGVIEAVGASHDFLRFSHVPLAEYLAGWHLVNRMNRNEKEWQRFLRIAEDMPGAPESVREFILAVRDCALARASDVQVPDHIIGRLNRFVGLDSGAVRHSRLQQRIKRLIDNLSVPEAEDRLAAALALGKIGPEAKGSVSALLGALRDDDRYVRQAAAEALLRIDPQRMASVDTLLEVERANEQMRYLMAVPESPFERPGLRVVHRLERASSMSGDFYNLIPRGDGSLGIYLVDVEGHGLIAAQQAQSVKQVVSRPGLDWGTGEARQQLELADRLISEDLGAQHVAVTMNFTEVDPATRVVRHANAGMPFPLLFRGGQAQPDLLQAAGVYVGAGYGRYPVQPERVEAQAGDGDILILYSDGIVEAKDHRGRLFGQRGIIAAVARVGLESPERIVDEIFQAVKAHADRSFPDDDQTLIVVQIGNPARGVRLTEVKTLDIVGDDESGIECSLMNAGDTGFASHEYLRTAVKGWAEAHGFSEARARQIWVAAWEAIQNAVKHGSRRGDVIHIRLRSLGGVLNIELVQPMLWRNWDAELGERRKKMLDDSQELLLGGTVIMLKLADKISVSNQGRKIVMHFSANPEGRQGEQHGR